MESAYRTSKILRPPTILLAYMGFWEPACTFPAFSCCFAAKRDMGGGAMRTAAKISGFGSYCGFRSLPPFPAVAEHSALRPARASVPAIVSTASVSTSDVLLKNGESDPVPVQWPSREVDDWEFAGDAELFDGRDPSLRVVFGELPTIDEAREATSDLKDALDKIYFSSSIASSCDCSSAVERSNLCGPLNFEHPDTKACITSNSAPVVKSVPKPVLSAFYLLKESPEVQNVVASLAADKNVWDSVMKNEKVMEFYKSQQTSPAFPIDTKAGTEESFAGHGSVEKPVESSGNKFAWFVGNVKLQVAKIVNDFSEFFQRIFGSSAEERSSIDSGSGGADFVDKTIGASFIALAILAIIVVLLKRK